LNRFFELTITEDMAGKTIKEILYDYYDMSARLINRLKLSNGILLNGKSQFVTAIVHQGDILKISLPLETSLNIVATAMPLEIVYEDHDIMVIDKPPNLPVHPSQGNYSNTLANGVMYYWQQKGFNHIYRPVNRLDKDTSGLIIIAKNQYAHQQFANQITNKQLKRKYIAIVHGNVAQEKGTIDLPIARKEGSTIERMVSEDGQQAVTHYKVLKRVDNFTVIELVLQTGRTHQIRVHMSYIGHPLVGDWLYGKEEQELISRQALHSYSLEFIHPVSRQVMNFKSDIPGDMRKLIENV
jgi:23S rRNA pseudouridine1911/1915/1917 synthase